MSRIAKYPVTVPDKVQVTVDKSKVVVKGPLGTLEQAITHEVVVKLEDGKVTFAALAGMVTVFPTVRRPGLSDTRSTVRG